jgi:hypothetical protein
MGLDIDVLHLLVGVVDLVRVGVIGGREDGEGLSHRHQDLAHGVVLILLDGEFVVQGLEDADALGVVVDEVVAPVQEARGGELLFHGGAGAGLLLGPGGLLDRVGGYLAVLVAEGVEVLVDEGD